MGPVDVDHWLDLVGLVIVGTALVAVPTVPAWISARRSGKAQEQLRNGSKDSAKFRDVFDEFVHDVRELFAAQAEDIRDLRREVRDERTARRDFEARVGFPDRRRNPRDDAPL